jgi:hypothetical protein
LGQMWVDGSCMAWKGKPQRIASPEPVMQV